MVSSIKRKENETELILLNDLNELISFVENVKKQKRVVIDERTIQSIQHIPNSLE